MIKYDNKISLKKRGVQKIILAFLGIFVFATLANLFLPFILHSFAKDIPLVDDSDLRLQKVHIQEEENAYFDLLDALHNVHEPEDFHETREKMSKGLEWDSKIAEALVAENIDTLQLLQRAAQKPYFQNPDFSDPQAIVPWSYSPFAHKWFRIAQLGAIHALSLVEQGKEKEAFEKSMDLVLLGHKILIAQGPLSEYISGMLIQQIGFETMHRVMFSSSFSSVELRKHINALSSFGEYDLFLQNAFRVEYYDKSSMVNILKLADRQQEVAEQIRDIFSKEDVKIARNNYYFQPNKTKLLFMENARSWIEMTQNPCWERQGLELPPNLVPQNRIQHIIEENILGKKMHDALKITFSRDLFVRPCNLELLVTATQSLMAVKAYHNDTGDYPASLDDLVPHYLSSVPIDPFDGEQLKYSYEKKIIYSVGVEGADLGGSTGDESLKMPNPTFPIDS